MKQRTLWLHGGILAAVLALTSGAVYLSQPAGLDNEAMEAYAIAAFSLGVEMREVDPVDDHVAMNSTTASVVFEDVNRAQLAFAPPSVFVALHHTQCQPDSTTYYDGIWHCAPPNNNPGNTPPPRYPDPGTCPLDHYWDDVGGVCRYGGQRCPNGQQFNYYLGQCVGGPTPNPPATPPAEVVWQITIPYTITVVGKNLASDVTVTIRITSDDASRAPSSETMTFGPEGGARSSNGPMFTMPESEARSAGFNVVATARAQSVAGREMSSHATSRVTMDGPHSFRATHLSIDGLGVDTQTGEARAFLMKLRPVEAFVHG